MAGRRTGRRTRRRWWALLAVVLVPLLALQCCSADGLFYRPDGHAYASSADTGHDVEELRFRAPGGPWLHGWWVAAEGEARGTVVFCHGNSHNLTRHWRTVSWLPRCGFHLLLFDYRGYGRSEGAPTRKGTVEDAVAAIDLGLGRDPDRVVVFGHSLGGAIAVPAVARRPDVKALVVESSFPSYRAVARATAPVLSPLVSLLVSDDLDPVDHLDEVAPRPLLVVHGTADHIVPYRLGEGLFEHAAEPKTMFTHQGGGHATPWFALGEEFETLVSGFFDRALSGGGG